MAEFDPDPAFLRARREAWTILGAWLVCMAWTVGVSWWMGYGEAAGEAQRVLGWPAWVFWGVAIPWLASTAFTVVFALHWMADDAVSDGPESAAAPRP